MPGLTITAIPAFSDTQIDFWAETALWSLNAAQISAFTFSQIPNMTAMQRAAIGLLSDNKSPSRALG